jgi:hypothetical protein
MTKKVIEEQESHKEYSDEIPGIGDVLENPVFEAEWSRGQSSPESDPAAARLAELETELNTEGADRQVSRRVAAQGCRI